MKFLAMALVLLLSISAGAESKFQTAHPRKKVKATDAKTAVVVPDTTTPVPCDSKEDILKKLEEKKKAEAASGTPKAFSLQGGDTGCSVK